MSDKRKRDRRARYKQRRREAGKLWGIKPRRSKPVLVSAGDVDRIKRALG